MASYKRDQVHHYKPENCQNQLADTCLTAMSAFYVRAFIIGVRPIEDLSVKGVSTVELVKVQSTYHLAGREVPNPEPDDRRPTSNQPPLPYGSSDLPLVAIWSRRINATQAATAFSFLAETPTDRPRPAVHTPRRDQ